MGGRGALVCLWSVSFSGRDAPLPPHCLPATAMSSPADINSCVVRVPGRGEEEDGAGRSRTERGSLFLLCCSASLSTALVLLSLSLSPSLCALPPLPCTRVDLRCCKGLSSSHGRPLAVAFPRSRPFPLPISNSLFFLSLSRSLFLSPAHRAAARCASSLSTHPAGGV